MGIPRPIGNGYHKGALMLVAKLVTTAPPCFSAQKEAVEPSRYANAGDAGDRAGQQLAWRDVCARITAEDPVPEAGTR